jgi:hypothetical protein
MTLNAERHLAQFNLAVLKRGPGDPRLVSFSAGANLINRAAQTAPGHVWSTQDVFNDSTFATRSVWESLALLREFVYSGIHHRYLRRSDEWFQPGKQPNLVLWYVEPGYRPGLDEAKRRLTLLRETGPSATAFDFASAMRFARDAT